MQRRPTRSRGGLSQIEQSCIILEEEEEEREGEEGDWYLEWD